MDETNDNGVSPSLAVGLDAEGHCNRCGLFVHNEFDGLDLTEHECPPGFLQPAAARSTAAQVPGPLSKRDPKEMTERDHLDCAVWHKRLGELADAYAAPGLTDVARRQARAQLMLHALDCATGWRQRTARLQASGNQDKAHV